MDLHRRDSNGLQRVQDRHTGVGIRSRVDDDAVILAVCSLDGIYDGTLMVGLKLVDIQVLPGCRFLQQRKQVEKGVFSVDGRFTDAQHIDIRAVDDKDIHGFSSKIRRIRSAASVGV